MPTSQGPRFRGESWAVDEVWTQGGGWQSYPRRWNSQLGREDIGSWEGLLSQPYKH